MQSFEFRRRYLCAADDQLGTVHPDQVVVHQPAVTDTEHHIQSVDDGDQGGQYGNDFSKAHTLWENIEVIGYFTGVNDDEQLRWEEERYYLADPRDSQRRAAAHKERGVRAAETEYRGDKLRQVCVQGLHRGYAASFSRVG